MRRERLDGLRPPGQHAVGLFRVSDGRMLATAERPADLDDMRRFLADTGTQCTIAPSAAATEHRMYFDCQQKRRRQ